MNGITTIGTWFTTKRCIVLAIVAFVFLTLLKSDITSKRFRLSENTDEAGLDVIFALSENVDRTPKPRSDCTLFHTMQGRLGNQLFQLASMQGLAAKSACSLCLRGVEELANDFEGVPPECSAATPPNQVSEDGYAIFHDWTFHNDTVVNGFLQSFQYFEADVRSKIKIKHHVVKEAREVVRAFHDKVTAGIHVRRSDTLSLAYPGTHPNERFFDFAMQYYRNKFQSVQFLVVSDDRNWCASQSFFQTNDVLVLGLKRRWWTWQFWRPALTKEHRPVVDMAILASCTHNIATVGSFGWWGAFLGGGEVVHYTWQDMAFNESKGFVGANYYPPNWVLENHT